MNHECKCMCRDFVIIFLNNGDPFIAKRGEQTVTYIKKLLGIPDHENLVQVVENGCPIKFEDDKKVVLKGCETFYGCPPGAGNSKEDIEKELLAEPFENTFGVKPALFREAGGYVIVLPQFAVSERKKVDVALEWPKQNRLLFSERIETPMCANPNWSPNYSNIRIAGRVWQGVSLQTKEMNPLKVLLAYLRGLV